MKIFIYAVSILFAAGFLAKCSHFIYMNVESYKRYNRDMYCASEGDYTIAKFNDTCMNGKSQGYFKIPSRYIVHCYSKKKWDEEKRDSHMGPELILSVPPLDLMPNISLKARQKNITIAIDDILSERRKYNHCNGASIDALMKQYTGKKNSFPDSKFSSYPHGRHKIENIGTNEKYDFYYREDQQKFFYFVKCAHRNKECHGEGTNISATHPDYQVSFPIEYSAHAYEIMDSIPEFLNRMHVEDTIKEK